MSFLKGKDTVEKQESNLKDESSEDENSASEVVDSPDDSDPEDSSGTEAPDSEDEVDENKRPETAFEFSARQERKPMKRVALKGLQLNFQSEEKKTLKEEEEEEVSATSKEFSPPDLDKKQKIEEAKEKKIKAKLQKQKIADEKRLERLSRIKAKVKACERSAPPLNQSNQSNSNTMEVVIKEEPAQQSPMTLFCLSVAGRLSAMPLHIANALTLPILALVVEAEEKIALSSATTLAGMSNCNSKQEMLVQQAFKVGKDCVAVAGFGLELKGRDISTLGPLQWLNDQVVNMYFQLIEKRNQSNDFLPSVKSFSTFFYPALVKNQDLDVLTTNGIDRDILLVPVFHDYGHWALIIIDNRLKSVALYDSQEISTEKALEHIQVVVTFLQMVIPHDEWLQIHETDGPKQLNGSDCGVFMCMYAELSTRGAATTFTQGDIEQLRKKMIYEIMTQSINTDMKWS